MCEKFLKCNIGSINVKIEGLYLIHKYSLGVALWAVDLLLVLAGGEGLAHQAPAARLALEAGGVEAADQSEVSLWSRDPLSANHSSPAAPGLDVLALRGLAAPGAGVPHVGRVAVLQHTAEKGGNGISR